MQKDRDLFVKRSRPKIVCWIEDELNLCPNIGPVFSRLTIYLKLRSVHNGVDWNELGNVGIVHRQNHRQNQDSKSALMMNVYRRFRYFLFAAAMLSLALSLSVLRPETATDDDDDNDIMRSSTVPEEAPSAQSLRLFPRKNANISLADAFQDHKTFVYFFHQRKAGGSSLRKFLLDEFIAAAGRKTARSQSYVPCNIQDCKNWDPNPRRQFMGKYRLLAGHLSFTTAAARAVYGEAQILITNFREPVSRLVSCIKYRFHTKLPNDLERMKRHSM